MRALVTGGKGEPGRLVVAGLRERGHEVAIGTRRPQAASEVTFDLAGAMPDLGSIDVIVHLATETRKLDVDRSGTRRLFEAAARSGVRHVVFLSIVGVDGHPFPYYRAKVANEQALEDSGVGYTILRSTQFHSFIPRVVDALAALRVVALPSGLPVQPIDVSTVAARLVEVVDDGPTGRAGDLGGPEVLDLRAMARAYLRTAGRRVPMVPLPMRGRMIAAFRAGGHLTPHRDTTGCTYHEYLAGRRGRLST